MYYNKILISFYVCHLFCQSTDGECLTYLNWKGLMALSTYIEIRNGDKIMRGDESLGTVWDNFSRVH